MASDKDNQAMVIGIVLAILLIGSFACLVNNFMRVARAHQWSRLHMPLLPDSSNLRLDAALRDAEDGFNVCDACAFENLKRNIFCMICGTPIAPPEIDEAKTKKKLKMLKKKKKNGEDEVVGVQVNHRRQQRALRRKEWARKVDVEGKLYWYRDASVVADSTFPGYVLRMKGEEKPAEATPEIAEPATTVETAEPENEPTDDMVSIVVTETVAAVTPNDTEANATATDSSADLPSRVSAVFASERGSDDDANATEEDTEMTQEERRQARKRALKLCTVDDVAKRLEAEFKAREVELEEAGFADPAKPALTDGADTDLHDDAKVLTQHAQLDFPTKLAEFVTRTATVLVPPEQSFLKLKVRREYLLEDSIDILVATPENLARCVIRMDFMGEQGVDAGGVYREWLVIFNSKVVRSKAGIFRCVDRDDQTYYLNPNSRHTIGENHLAHFFATGRFLGRALLEGNPTGFHLSLPLLKIMLGMPVSFSDLEYFDREAYQSMQWILQNDDIEALGLDFSVNEKVGNELITVDLIPGGRHIAVTDDNKLEYLDRKFRYMLFDSVAPQLYAFLKGLYEVIPPDLLMLFDPEELDFIISGSDEIDVDDWERNAKYTVDLIEHPARIWFWEIVREMPNEYRRRLLLFTTGSSRVPLAGFMALTSYDGRLCPFTLKGIELGEGGYIRSHACFNRLELPRYNSKASLKTVLYAVLTTDQYGFTID
ncbi:hypothetical protein Poli38472_003262 [Pythium oligandrum]|uniref:HECT-type E3 ubiquitin transferase n=1 Tax=Pythium oligandrum TaxID=41045 RepID=A0A8K1C6A8_PYTOL|nr:hypothetical protein Poli38472_003262 [Pythium oligandrum]|eukprot:TMW57337.1 hypothetical protein Poli38472_003262 [Pythium oligandrum]